MTIAMNGCEPPYWDEQESLAEVRELGTLTVLTTRSPLTYIRSRKGVSFGIDHDLLEKFAAHYNLKLSYKTFPNEEEVLRALARGEGDIAASRIRTLPHSLGFLNGPAYEETYLSLYCHKKSRVENIADLSNKKVTILNKDNYLGLAERLKLFAPNVEVEVVANKRAQHLIEDLSKKTSDCAIAENLAGNFYSRYYHSVDKVTQLSDSYSLSWLLSPKHQNLQRLMQSWYKHASREDELMRVLDRYKNYIEKLDTRDIARFLKKVETTLPQYMSDFRKSADAHHLPWQLVAAVAYQESHWNPDARSFTGVRGLMQLTTHTANLVGIDDRTDPTQSIWGGAKYLRFLINRTSKDLDPKDRLAFALASYNMGLAHMRDAQKLAVKLGKNPRLWKDMREVIPLLADPKYASQLEFGHARGYEAVTFTERVKSFYTLINTGT